MKKLLALAMLALGSGCSTDPHKVYTHSNFMRANVEKSEKEEVRVSGSGFVTTESLADLLGNADGKVDEKEIAGLERIPYNEPIYFAFEVSLPADIQIEKETYTLKEDSNKIHLDAFNKLASNPWKKVSSPLELAGKENNYLILEVKKAHPVFRCPTGEHVMAEPDFYVVSSIRMATKKGISQITIYHPDGGLEVSYDILDYPSAKEELEKHYAVAHTEYPRSTAMSGFMPIDHSRMNSGLFNHNQAFYNKMRCNPKLQDHCPPMQNHSPKPHR